jgi:hypothetical protein
MNDDRLVHAGDEQFDRLLKVRDDAFLHFRDNPDSYEAMVAWEMHDDALRAYVRELSPDDFWYREWKALHLATHPASPSRDTGNV